MWQDYVTDVWQPHGWQEQHERYEDVSVEERKCYFDAVVARRGRYVGYYIDADGGLVAAGVAAHVAAAVEEQEQTRHVDTTVGTTTSATTSATTT